MLIRNWPLLLFSFFIINDVVFSAFGNNSKLLDAFGFKAPPKNKTDRTVYML